MLVLMWHTERESIHNATLYNWMLYTNSEGEVNWWGNPIGQTA